MTTTDPIDEQHPNTITLYLPNGEVDVLRGCTAIALETTKGFLRFTDVNGTVIITSLPFTLAYPPPQPIVGEDQPEAGPSAEPTL